MSRSGNFSSAALLLTLQAGLLWSQPAIDSYNRGLACFRDGKLDEAIRYVREATEQQPVYPEAYNTLGLLLGKKGQDPTSVLAAFETATRQREEFAEAHYNLGLLLAQLGGSKRASPNCGRRLLTIPGMATPTTLLVWR